MKQHPASGKKLLSLLLALGMAASLSLTAFAEDAEPAVSQAQPVSPATNETAAQPQPEEPETEPKVEPIEMLSEETPQLFSAWNVQINEANFPDATFRAYVSKEFDQDGDGMLTPAERDAVTKIDVSESSVFDLTGLCCFTKLTYLDCQYNYIDQLDLSSNTALTYLDFTHNNLTELDISNNTALTEIYFYFNKLTTLDVSNNTALTTLVCGEGTPLESLDVSKNKALMTLSCDNNGLTTLDLSKNAALIGLECYGNKLTALDLSGNATLTTVECYENELTSLNVSQNTMLTSLDCNTNQLTELDVHNNYPYYENGILYLGETLPKTITYNYKTADTGTVNHLLVKVTLTEAPEPAPAPEDYHVDIKDEVTVTDELKDAGLDTPEKIVATLTEVLTDAVKELIGKTLEGTKTMEVTLLVKQPDGTMVPVTKLPDSGLDLRFDYPAGTNKDSFDFVVTHMKHDGSIEVLVPRPRLRNPPRSRAAGTAAAAVTTSLPRPRPPQAARSSSSRSRPGSRRAGASAPA